MNTVILQDKVRQHLRHNLNPVYFRIWLRQSIGLSREASYNIARCYQSVYHLFLGGTGNIRKGD